MNVKQLRKKLKKIEKKHGNLEVVFQEPDSWRHREVGSVFLSAENFSIYGNTPEKVVIR